MTALNQLYPTQPYEIGRVQLALRNLHKQGYLELYTHHPIPNDTTKSIKYYQGSNATYPIEEAVKAIHLKQPPPTTTSPTIRPVSNNPGNSSSPKVQAEDARRRRIEGVRNRHPKQS